MAKFLGVDTGGTFTDFILFDDELKPIRIHKALSTPESPEKAILQGIADLCFGTNNLTKTWLDNGRIAEVNRVGNVILNHHLPETCRKISKTGHA